MEEEETDLEELEQLRLQLQQAQKRGIRDTMVTATSISSIPDSHMEEEEETDLEELEQLARKLKQRRTTLRYTQGDVGLAVGKLYGSRHFLSGSTISSFESLNLSFESMCKLKPLLQKWLDDTDPTLSDPAILSRESLKDIKRKKKYKRVIIKPEMKLLLEKSFLQQPRPLPEEIAVLAEQLGLEKLTVINWFQRRRREEKLVSEPVVITKSRQILPFSVRESLEKSYLQEPYPTREEYTLLGEKLGLERVVVRSWYNKRRSTAKRRAKIAASRNQHDQITYDTSHSVSTSNLSRVTQIQQSTTGTPVSLSTPFSSCIISSTDAVPATTTGQNATPMQDKTLAKQSLVRTKNVAELVSATNSQATASSVTTVIPTAITPFTQSTSDRKVPQEYLSL